MLLTLKVLCPRNYGITTHCFPNPFRSFLWLKIMLVTSFPLHQSGFFFTSMCILIFLASEFIDVMVLINQISLGKTGVANRQITKAYVPSNESNISNLLFPQECICFLHCFRVEPSIICQHVFL